MSFKFEDRVRNVVLDITSWRGMSIGAVHYYGHLHYYDENGKHQKHELRRTLDKADAAKLTEQHNKGTTVDGWYEYEEGDTTGNFDTHAEIIEIAKGLWKELSPESEVMLLGSFGVGEPQECIDGDDEIKEAINELLYKSELLSWEDDRDQKYQIYVKYCKLMRMNP